MRSAREETVRIHLDDTAREFEKAREHYDEAQIIYAIALEKMLSIRRLATHAMSSADMMYWDRDHPTLAYAGATLTEAIPRVLYRYAVAAADKATFQPEMTREQIEDLLTQGGYVFSGSVHAREVNAALINLRGVKKIGGKYRHAEADQIRALLLAPATDERSEEATSEASSGRPAATEG